MTSGINAKDSLINDVIDDWQTRGVGVSKDNVVEANYMIQASRTVKGHYFLFHTAALSRAKYIARVLQ